MQPLYKDTVCPLFRTIIARWLWKRVIFDTVYRKGSLHRLHKPGCANRCSCNGDVFRREAKNQGAKSPVDFFLLIIGTLFVGADSFYINGKKQALPPPVPVILSRKISRPSMPRTLTCFTFNVFSQLVGR